MNTLMDNARKYTNDDRMYRLPEYMVFPTKEELLKSL